MKVEKQTKVEGPISLRDAVRLVWASDRYPCNNEYDLRQARRLEAEALELAMTAMPSPDDPPEFRQWVEALRQPGLTNPVREAVFDAMYDYFEPEKPG